VEDDKCVELANLHVAPQAGVEAFFPGNFLQKIKCFKPKAERKILVYESNENF
jgi:hypothetical protein